MRYPQVVHGLSAIPGNSRVLVFWLSFAIYTMFTLPATGSQYKQSAPFGDRLVSDGATEDGAPDGLC